MSFSNGNSDVFVDLREGEIFEVQSIKQADRYDNASLYRISSGKHYVFDCCLVTDECSNVRVGEAINVIGLINDVLAPLLGMVLGDLTYIDEGGNEIDVDEDKEWLEKTATLRLRIEKV